MTAAPDGSFIVHTANDALSLRLVGQLESTPIPGTRGAREPFVSPDNEWIGFFSDGQLRKVAVSGGAPVTLCGAMNPYGASWGEDDTILFGQGAAGIWRIAGTGDTPEVVIEVAEGELAHGPQMLPGGEWVLFTLRPAATNSWDAAQIVVQSLATGERIVVIEGGRDARYVPTGHLVYGLNDVVFAVAFDLETRQVVGGAVSLVDGVASTGFTGSAQFSMARNGSLVYAPGAAAVGSEGRGLMWVNGAGQEEPLPHAPGPYFGVSLSPDGTRAALGTNAGNNLDVWVAELERGSLIRVTTDAAPDTQPLWTPDGESVVYESTRDGTPALYRKTADGTGTAEHLFAFDGATEIVPLDWTLDGTALVVVVETQETGLDIGLVSIAPPGSWEPLIQTEARETYPALSPDGRWMAYASDETGRSEVYVQRFPELGQRSPISIGGATSPAWSADGRELFYLFAPGNGGPRAMMRVTIESNTTTLMAGQPEQLFDWRYYDLFGPQQKYDISPDDGRFLTIATSPETGKEGSAFDLVFIQNWTQGLLERVPVP